MVLNNTLQPYLLTFKSIDTMIKELLVGEFLQEAEKTRKLLAAIPDSMLAFKPSESSWTTAQLASHIAEVYNWYEGTLNADVLDMADYRYDKGDVSKSANILAKFEENFLKAKTSFENFDEATLMTPWEMKMGEQVLVPATPKIHIVRGFLMNHLYHHRGEMIIYFRLTGNKTPGLYGPTADDKR